MQYAVYIVRLRRSGNTQVVVVVKFAPPHGLAQFLDPSHDPSHAHEHEHVTDREVFAKDL